ncbi:hypothetical protein BCR37DRAFT_386135 [Protomyces lactucae-debilis]|uniref:Uncharacterized protein n=1 Tax=Protomyces lactucae-debilis TaxID=2754530 RepID=A0A1Y2FRE3_PROLT|nr:uncharacterized protein BCR37DRAFT_386135 [Protomyces lactucae-debilis]ORY85766.1 hypothetical protein BCR37DRAFT_386135 [Protomyces lactucae-debilis]
MSSKDDPEDILAPDSDPENECCTDRIKKLAQRYHRQQDLFIQSSLLRSSVSRSPWRSVKKRESRHALDEPSRKMRAVDAGCLESAPSPPRKRAKMLVASTRDEVSGVSRVQLPCMLDLGKSVACEPGPIRSVNFEDLTPETQEQTLGSLQYQEVVVREPPQGWHDAEECSSGPAIQPASDGNQAGGFGVTESSEQDEEIPRLLSVASADSTLRRTIEQQCVQTLSSSRPDTAEECPSAEDTAQLNPLMPLKSTAEILGFNAPSTQQSMQSPQTSKRSMSDMPSATNISIPERGLTLKSDLVICTSTNQTATRLVNLPQIAVSDAHFDPVLQARAERPSVSQAAKAIVDVAPEYQEDAPAPTMLANDAPGVGLTQDDPHSQLPSRVTPPAFAVDVTCGRLDSQVLVLEPSANASSPNQQIDTQAEVQYAQDSLSRAARMELLPIDSVDAHAAIPQPLQLPPSRTDESCSSSAMCAGQVGGNAPMMFFPAPFEAPPLAQLDTSLDFVEQYLNNTTWNAEKEAEKLMLDLPS